MEGVSSPRLFIKTVEFPRLATYRNRQPAFLFKTERIERGCWGRVCLSLL